MPDVTIDYSALERAMADIGKVQSAAENPAQAVRELAGRLGFDTEDFARFSIDYCAAVTSPSPVSAFDFGWGMLVAAKAIENAQQASIAEPFAV